MGWAAPYSARPIRGRVVVPGSKSETNRALVLAALADRPSFIGGALASRDSELMIAALRAFGVGIIETDVIEVCPPASFNGAKVDCGLAGTVMRFAPAVAALADGPSSFFGDPHASARPMKPLLDGFRQLGIRVDGDFLPFVLSPSPRIGAKMRIDASESSQFISGPLLGAARLPNGLTLEHTGDSLPSRPHIDMTVQMLRARGVSIIEPDSRTWIVEPGPIAALDEKIAPDLTNAAVFFAAAMLAGGSVTVPNWPTQTSQPGTMFLDIAQQMGARVKRDGTEVTVIGGDDLIGADIDLSAASELTPVVAALALFAKGQTRISGVAHIRGHETDRLSALATEFGAAGADITETVDGLQIKGGSQLRPHLFETYADHRMAHAAALVGLRVADTELTDIGCVSKTMPDFAIEWDRLCGA